MNKPSERILTPSTPAASADRPEAKMSARPYTPPRIVTHSASEVDSASLAINACASFLNNL